MIVSPFHLITLNSVRMLENNKRSFMPHKMCNFHEKYVNSLQDEASSLSGLSLKIPKLAHIVFIECDG